jgi:hypothetical protein
MPSGEEIRPGARIHPKHEFYYLGRDYSDYNHLICHQTPDKFFQIEFQPLNGIINPSGVTLWKPVVIKKSTQELIPNEVFHQLSRKLGLIPSTSRDGYYVVRKLVKGKKKPTKPLMSHAEAVRLLEFAGFKFSKGSYVGEGKDPRRVNLDKDIGVLDPTFHKQLLKIKERMLKQS